MEADVRKSVIIFSAFFLLVNFSYGQLPEGEFIKAKTAPVIDGNLDSVWHTAQTYPISSLIDPLNREFPDSVDLQAWFKGMWDEENLYIFISIKDDTKRIYNNTQTKQAPHHFDQGELYFDYHYSRPSAYFEPTTTAFEFFRGPLKIIDTHKGSTGNDDGEQDTEDGWTQELVIPLENLKNSPGKSGLVFGFDVHVNDGDTSDSRENAVAWSDPSDSAWKNPRVLGKVTLVEEDK